MAEYTTANYGSMMRDEARIAAYVGALRKVIVPGETTVLEIGTGTGVVAFAAAHAGARHVYAVEPNPAIEVAREIAALNGVTGIDFIQAMSTELDLPRADVVLSDLRGMTPLYQHHIPSIVDARERLLAPGGTLIARADDVFVAPATAPKTWHEHIGFWDQNPVGLDMTPAKRLASNSLFHCDAQPGDLLAPPARLCHLDYATVTTPHVVAEVRFGVVRDGLLHGFSVWFDTQVDAEISLSNAPGQPMLAYGRPFLPLLAPFELRAGEALELAVSARLVGDQYYWTWSGGVSGDSTRTFAQSSFQGAEISLPSLQKVRLDARPQRSASADRLLRVLDAMDGNRSVAELAAMLEPQLDSSAALSLVSAVVAEHGRRT